MAVVALVLMVVYFTLAFGVRSVLQVRRTGSTGFRGVSGRPGSAEWMGGVLFVVALALLVLAPIADLAGWSEPLRALDGTAAHVIGLALAGLGIAGTLLSQEAMGDAWRIGVDEDERTPLVASGPFKLVRNPIFSAMVLAAAGLVLLVPNAPALAGLLLLVTAIELQVRAVEEPYLTRSHGARYLDYAARAGRFVPGIGLLRPAGDRESSRS